MTTFRIARALVVPSFSLLVVIAGCGSATPEANTTAHQANSGAHRAQTPSRVASNERADADAARRNACASLAPVHFDYDSADLQPRAREALSRSAECLKADPSRRVAVTGMTDPRGTEEYNLALGDRRARSTAGYLQSLGVDGRQLQPTSVGEEMATGEDESGWTNDRRAEFH